VWIHPIPEYIKFNTDAAVGLSSSSIAVVARNWRGEVVLALSKRVNTTIPLQAEAEALLWADHIAAELGAEEVIFESDSKVCIDELNIVNVLNHWRIRNRLHTFLLISNNHPLWSCNWAPRVANGVAHFLARWSLQNRFWGTFVFELSPPSFSAAVLKDSIHVPIFVGPV
jgi:ribonuclease HI